MLMRMPCSLYATMVQGECGSTTVDLYASSIHFTEGTLLMSLPTPLALSLVNPALMTTSTARRTSAVSLYATSTK